MGCWAIILIKRSFLTLMISVILWFYVSAEMEALRTASLVKAPCCTLSHSAPGFCLSTSTIQQSEDSVSILQARNAPPVITDFIIFYISFGNSEVFGSGPFVQPAGPGMSFDCTEGSVVAQILFSSLCPAWWMLILYNSNSRRTLNFKNSFTYDLHRM